LIPAATTWSTTRWAEFAGTAITAMPMCSFAAMRRRS
jgi:hypothetical protein